MPIKDIAEKIGVKKTTAEHWFRTDKCFSIPDPEVWPVLKELLRITDDSFDKSIMTIEYKDNKYDQSNRIHNGQKPSPTLTRTSTGNDLFALAENTIGRQPLNGGNGNGFTKNGPMYTLNATGVHGVAHGFEPGIAKREGNPSRFTEEKSPTLRANMGDNQVAVAHTFKVRGGCEGGGKGYLGQDEKTYTISTIQDQHLYHHYRVRKLTPVECERLQGFPDNYTNIKENCPDGHRYKAMGNSMAVPVMRWIGTRINNYKEDKDAV